MISHIRLLSLPVSDQERARDFYVEVLGFDLIRDNPMGPFADMNPNVSCAAVMGDGM